MPTRREAIKAFLIAKSPSDLGALYTYDQEVQVNVAQDNGERIEGEYEGHKWLGWTDGVTTWKSFRIPFNANSNPNYVDSNIKFDIAQHAEGIGMTGWNWVSRKSLWVAYDFDAICGHSSKHLAKLSDTQLVEVQQAACDIPWVTVRRSTSGNGLHLYVMLPGIDTENHNEHAALARAILAKMSGFAGFNFDSKVDNCGSNIWVWHRKFEKVGGKNGPGLKLIKQGETLTDVPPNWRDHVAVTSGKKRRIRPSFIQESEEETFEEFCGQRQTVPLDSEHKRLFKFLEESGAYWWFDNDKHMLVCHTWDLKEAHAKLGYRGIFDTLASGAEHGADQNCFAYPMRNGSWSVRRHTRGVQEATTWDQDSSGWTRCYLNLEPDLSIAARSYGGVENEKKGFVFQTAEDAERAALAVGASIKIPVEYRQRQTTLKVHKDGRLIVEIEAGKHDKVPEGYLLEKTKLKKVVNADLGNRSEPEVRNYDDVIRHLISETGIDLGWAIKNGTTWCNEPLVHIRAALCSLGVSNNDINMIIGSSVVKPWTVVTKPFQPEYLGNREWNRNAPQLAFAPNPDRDNLNYPAWTSLLKHVGQSLDFAIKNHEWCKKNAITTGGDYLKLWVASLIQFPLQPLPYLFLYGPQNSGKSTLYEALTELMTKGVMDASPALQSNGSFNGELENVVLGVIDEVDLSKDKGTAYNRIKDWVTARKITVHPKNITPYQVTNSLHFIHTSNHVEYCPIFQGDTRITVCYVPLLDEKDFIPNKTELIRTLKKQAPDFLASILSIEIPPSPDRLNIPIIVTKEKINAQTLNETDLEKFLSEKTFRIDGEMILVSELFEKFIEWLDPNQVGKWSKIRMNRELMILGYPKGRCMRDAAKHYIGNVSWVAKESDKPRLVSENDVLTSETK